MILEFFVSSEQPRNLRSMRLHFPHGFLQPTAECVTRIKSQAGFAMPLCEMIHVKDLEQGLTHGKSTCLGPPLGPEARDYDWSIFKPPETSMKPDMLSE